MDAKLDKAVREFVQRRRQNPSPASVSTEFQMFLVAKGIKTTDPKALTEAALKAGVPREKLGDFMEELASWL